MHDQPLVSVLMPCYNAEAYLESAMLSMLNQTYRNIEIVAINDCSTDKTKDILTRLSSQDERIKVYNNEQNLKLIATLNKGVTLCNGEYIARMDSDDISFPKRLEKQVAFLEKNKDIDIVSTLFYTFHKSTPEKSHLSLHDNPLMPDDVKTYMLFKSGICHPAVMLRKRVFTELHLKFESEYLHVEDYAFWSKAVYRTKLANIGEPLLYYRVHPNQVSSLHNKLQRENKRQVFKLHLEEFGIPITDDNLDFHSSIAECVPAKVRSLAFIQQCETYMQLLENQYKQNGFSNIAYLKKMLSIHWLRLCANAQLGLKTFKLAKQSEFYDKKNYKTQDFLIFYIKCIFKIKYGESFLYRFLFHIN